MNRTSLFIFNGRSYYVGAKVKIKEEYIQHCRFNSILQFTGYIIDENVYCFSSVQNHWEVYRWSSEQVSLYIDAVLINGVAEHGSERTDAKYIDGIVSAWMWYIFIMVFALFFNGVENIIITWCVATFIFFQWKNKKIKGG